MQTPRETLNYNHTSIQFQCLASSGGGKSRVGRAGCFPRVVVLVRPTTHTLRIRSFGKSRTYANARAATNGRTHNPARAFAYVGLYVRRNERRVWAPQRARSTGAKTSTQTTTTTHRSYPAVVDSDGGVAHVRNECIDQQTCVRSSNRPTDRPTEQSVDRKSRSLRVNDRRRKGMEN